MDGAPGVAVSAAGAVTYEIGPWHQPCSGERPAQLNGPLTGHTHSRSPAAAPPPPAPCPGPGERPLLLVQRSMTFPRRRLVRKFTIRFRGNVRLGPGCRPVVCPGRFGRGGGQLLVLRLPDTHVVDLGRGTRVAAETAAGIGRPTRQTSARSARVNSSDTELAQNRR
jgi:hypothetical protein